MTLKVSARLCVAIMPHHSADHKRNLCNYCTGSNGELLKLGKRTLDAIDNNSIRVPRVSKHVRPRLARYLAEASGG